MKYGQDHVAAWTGTGSGAGTGIGDSEGLVWVEKVKEWGWGCRGWDPELSESEDPEGCIKAKQYRQTMRVLEREELADQ